MSSSHESIELEISKGKLAVQLAISQKCDVNAAFHHPSLGYISLIYGDRNFGLKHTLDRRTEEITGDARLKDQNPMDVLLALIEVVLKGSVKNAGTKKIIEYNGYRAVLGVKEGHLFLLTGYKLT